MYCDGKLICVFGCGGDRDRGKRSLMGKIAVRKADHVIITDDNPRTEDPDRIITDIKQGISDNSSTEVIRDRKDAIERAIDESIAGDVVVVAGKGHETGQVIGTELFSFSDSAVIEGLQ